MRCAGLVGVTAMGCERDPLAEIFGDVSWLADLFGDGEWLDDLFGLDVGDGGLAEIVPFRRKSTGDQK